MVVASDVRVEAWVAAAGVAAERVTERDVTAALLASLVGDGGRKEEEEYCEN